MPHARDLPLIRTVAVGGALSITVVQLVDNFHPVRDHGERRKSAESHKRNLKRIPLGVASNFRAYDPYPIFVKEVQGSHFRDLDGNDYVDHNLCFGAIMAGHCHPAIVRVVEKRLNTGTMFSVPHDLEWELAAEICDRFPVEMVRFGSTGAEATMHAIRLAALRRAATRS